MQSFHCGLAGKKSVCNVGDLGSIPGLGRSHGEGKCYPLQYSGLENSMDCIVHGVAKIQTQLSDIHLLFTVKHVGSQFPNQGSNLCSLQWKHRILTTGSPGKSFSISS